MAIIERDSSGQLWQITVNPDGSLTSTPASSDLNFAPAFSRDATGQLWQITVTSDGGITTAKVADTDTNTVQLAASPQWLSRDPDGNLWQLAVNADGSITSTPSTDAPTPTEADGCTVTLQETVDLCRTHVDLMPLASVGGFSQEPARSLCNDVLQELCAQPYDWKFNSKDYGLLTTPVRTTCTPALQRSSSVWVARRSPLPTALRSQWTAQPLRFGACSPTASRSGRRSI
jgi:hypothetical protein